MSALSSAPRATFDCLAHASFLLSGNLNIGQEEAVVFTVSVVKILLVVIAAVVDWQ